MMRTAGESIHGTRLRALVVILWRAGLRINEALMLAETDLERRRGSILVRCGRAASAAGVGMDEWTWEQVEAWQRHRLEMPIGRSSASPRAPPRAGRGRRPALEPSCGASRSLQVSDAGSPPTNCATHMRSRWLAREYRSR